MYDKVKAIFKF